MYNDLLTAIASDKPFLPSQFYALHEQQLLTWASQEGVASLFYPKCGPIKSSLPTSLVQFFRTEYENALIYKDFALHVLNELSNRIVSSGRAVLTQGAALNEVIYKEPLCRSMGDIDIYLPDRNLSEISAILKDYGFKQYRQYLNVWYYKRLMIDLHEGLWGTDRFVEKEKIAPITEVKLDKSSLVSGFHILSPEHLAIHCAYHGVKHSFYKKIWCVDLALLKTRGVFTLSVQNRKEYVLKKFALGYLSSSGIESKVDFIHDQYSLSKMEKRAMSYFSARFSPGLGQLGYAILFPTTLQRLQYIIRLLLPSKGNLIQMYGSKTWPLLILYRLFSLVKHLKRMIFWKK